MTEEDSYLVQRIKEDYREGMSVEEIMEKWDMLRQQVLQILRVELKQEHEKKLNQSAEIDDLKRENMFLQRKIATFQQSGCSIPLCKRCHEPMNQISTENGIHYMCGVCGWVDSNDSMCKTKCCRRGLLLLAINAGYEYSEEDQRRYIEGGDI
jgi:hypothetical protein